MSSHFSPAETFQAFVLNVVANNVDDKDILEKLLEVLNRIDRRLKSIESSVSTSNANAAVLHKSRMLQLYFQHRATELFLQSRLN
jgi:hypothetical protein